MLSQFNFGKKYVTLASAWDDGDNITVVLNEYLKPGEKIFLRPNKFKSNPKHPDYTYSVLAEKYDDTEGEVLYESSKRVR